MRVEGSGKPPGSKLIRVSAEMELRDGVPTVRSLSVRGDFFALPEEGFEAAEASLRDLPLARLAEDFEAAMQARGVRLLGISGREVEEILRKAYLET
jgi:hypothetical protein